MLIGHSYGGMVATGVADRAEAASRRLIYLDAFAPKDGQSLFDLVGAEAEAKMRHGAADERRRLEGAANADAAGYRAGGCRLGRAAAPAAADPRLRNPKLRLTGQEAMLPRGYIYCKRARPGDVFRQFAERAQGARAGAMSRWMRATIRTSPVPGQLRDILVELLGKNVIGKGRRYGFDGRQGLA